MSVYTAILEWSKDLSDWQRDALRRLAIGPMPPAQLQELEYLCLKAQGLSIQGVDAVIAQPLDQTHLPSRSATGNSIHLDSIGAISNVNLISSTVDLEFGQTGLTVIYGYNGSGKSGYARILKRVCRARDGGSPICPNVYEEDDGALPSATITFTSGNE